MTNPLTMMQLPLWVQFRALGSLDAGIRMVESQRFTQLKSLGLALEIRHGAIRGAIGPRHASHCLSLRWFRPGPDCLAPGNPIRGRPLAVPDAEIA